MVEISKSELSLNRVSHGIDVETSSVEKKGTDTLIFTEKITYKKPSDKIEQTKSIQNISMDLIKRELTKEELEEYFILFNKEKTNLWRYLDGKK